MLNAEWSALKLVERSFVGHDVALLKFQLADASRPLALSTCACLLARVPTSGGSAGFVVRPYTPVSTNAMLGHFELLVKVYPGGAASQHLAQLPVGGSVEFKHIPVNVKVQYPFGVRKLVMIAGGTGVTPMIQALHAILGSTADETRVTLLYSNKEEKDILARGLLESWQKAHPHKLQIVHTLTREPSASGWSGHRGRIDSAFLREHLPRPHTNVQIFVCGPPSMYESLSGARAEKALTGVLAELGYSAAQVVKF